MLKKILIGLAVLILLPIVLLVAIGFQSGQDVNTLKPQYTYPESRFVKIDGMEVHCRVTGSGPALLLIHGVSSSLHTWEGWHDALSDQFQVISLDIPAFGLTGPHPEHDYSMPQYCALIDTLLDELGVDSLFIGGNSFGGYISWNYALHAPERVQKMILVDAGGYNTTKEVKNLGIQLSRHPLTAGITHYVTPQFLVEISVAEAYGDPSLIKPGVPKRYYDMITREGNREAFTMILQDLSRNLDNDPKIRSIQTPTLILWGDQDLIIAPECAGKFDAALPNSELIMYEGVGHIPMEEIPERSAADAAVFLLR